MHFLQTQANLFGQVRQTGFIGRKQCINRQGHQHAIERALASAFAQQVEQGAPAVGIGVGGVLGEEAPGGVDQHAVFSKIPIAITGAAGVTGELAINFVERKIQPRKIQQAGFAAALGADQHVPRQFIAPALAATSVHAGGFECAQRVFEACAQFFMAGIDQRFTALALLADVAVFGLFFTHPGPPTDKDHGQAPDQAQRTDGQQPRRGVRPEFMLIDRQQRPHPPHQQGNRQQQ